jgi:hypothetical protein
VADTDEQPPAVRLLGVALVLAGALLALASFRFLDWYAVPGQAADSAGSVTFSDLHDNADQLRGAGVSSAYFDWLSWVLLIALIVVGVAANVRTGLTDPLRVVGCFVGVLGVASTYYALAQHFDATGSSHNVFYNATWGVWAALIGFVAGAVGAVLGPGRMVT